MKTQLTYYKRNSSTCTAKQVVIAVIILMLTCISTQSVLAQKTKPIVQFSGIVAAGDSLFGLTGVHMINKTSRRGYVSGDKGYFSFPGLEGDSILFSFVGFKSRYVQIPEGCEDHAFTMIVELQVDTSQLAEIEVLPYPSIEMFKEAFVKLELPDDPLYENMNKNLDQRRLRRMMREMDMTASMNYQHYTLEQIKQYEQPNFIATTQLVNPMAWVKFIKALKNGDFKRKKYDEDSEYYDDY